MAGSLIEREISAVGKARGLRDPETCSSWRSAASARPQLVEREAVSGNVSRMGGGTKETTNRSRLSKMVEGKEEEEYSVDSSARSTRQAIRARKVVRRLRRVSLLKRQYLGGSTRTKLPIASSSPEQTQNSSFHHSHAAADDDDDDDDDDDHNDNDDGGGGGGAACFRPPQGRLLSSKPMAHDFGYSSSPDSPLMSGSRCRNLSIRSRLLRAAVSDELSSCSITPSVSASSVDMRCLRKQNPGCMGSCWDAVSKQVKDGRCPGWCSPSFSDTWKRRGSSLLCEGQTPCQKKKFSSVRRQKKAFASASLRRPLLGNNGHEDGSFVDMTSDEESTHLLEVALCNSHCSLSQKHSPVSFGEIVGQRIVVQSLRNAIKMRRIAPAYLFHGPRGTGKSSVARILAAALNCRTAAAENKPCGSCGECLGFVSGQRPKNIIELDATEGLGIAGILKILKNMQKLSQSSVSCRTVFIIDECQALHAEVWPTLVRFLEEPPPHSVFVLITVDPENLPHAVLSRCLKYTFRKISEADVVKRLEILSAHEFLDVEPEALRLIAVSSNGSLRDAEGVLDQLSLFGKRITPSLVIDLVGIVSNEKLIDLLETAMSANTADTVKKCRQVLDSGIDPVALMSQLAGVIIDAIVFERSSNIVPGRSMNSSSGRINRLQESLRILSEAEKQLKLTDERSTWFTAALLQLGSGLSQEAGYNYTASDRREHQNLIRKTNINLRKDEKRPSLDCATSSMCNIYERENPRRRMLQTQEQLDKLWRMCIENCHSKTLRQLLFAHGQLLSISETEGVVLVSLAFDDESAISRVQGYLGSITDAVETVIGQHAKVTIQCGVDAIRWGGVLPLPTGNRRSTDDSAILAAAKLDQSPYCIARRSVDCGETSLLQQRNRRPEDFLHESSAFASTSAHQSCKSTDARMKQKMVLNGRPFTGEVDNTTTQLDAHSKHRDEDLNRESNSGKVCSNIDRQQQSTGSLNAPNSSSWFQGSGRGCTWCFSWKRSGGNDEQECAACSASPLPSTAALEHRSKLRLDPCASGEKTSNN